MDCYEWWLNERERQRVIDVFCDAIALARERNDLVREFEIDELRRSFEDIVPGGGGWEP